MAIMKQNDCGTLSTSGEGTTVNVMQTNCGCGCGGSGSGGGTVAPPGTPEPTGGTGGGTGGNPGDGTNGGTGGNPPGSGPDGKPNSDGLDKLIIPPSCVLVGSPVNKPYGSTGFEFQDLSFKTALVTAVKSMPNVAADDDVVSAKLNVSGLAYGGLQIITDQPLVSNRKLSITDGENSTRKVAFKEEKAGASIGGIGVQGVGWRYSDTFSVVLGPNDVTIDGQMPNSFIPDFTTDKNTPAWLKIEACAAVVRHKADTDKSYGFFYTPLNNVAANFGGSMSVQSNILWDDSGIIVRSYADGGLFRAGDTLFGGNDTFEPSSIYMYIPADKAYTTLEIKGKTISSAQTVHVNVYDRTVGTTVTYTNVGSSVIPPTSTPVDGSDSAHTPSDITLSCTFPALVVGHIYAFAFDNSGAGGLPSWLEMKGTFGGA